MGDRGRANDRPVFCGNFEYDATERSILDLFEKFGPVDRIDMKTGFAFVYMADDHDGRAAIKALDRTEFGYKRRPLRVEWAKKMEPASKDHPPTNTLFVVNFDTRSVRESDIERHFERFGSLARVEIKRNYAFVEFKSIDDAKEAQRACHGNTFLGRTITVEFVEGQKDRGDRERSRSPYGGGRRGSPPRGRGRSPPGRGRGGSPRRRSPSPPRRQRSRSPDYTRGGGRSRSPRRSPGYRHRSPGYR